MRLLKNNKSNMYSMLIFYGFAAVIFFSTKDIMPVMKNQGVSSKFFPMIVAAGFVICGTLNLFTAIRKNKSGDIAQVQPEAQAEAQGEPRGKFDTFLDSYSKYLTMAVTIFYVMTLKELGFIVGSAVYLFIQMILLSTKKNRKYLSFAIISVVVPLVVYYLFLYAFETFLPLGVLDGIIVYR